MAVNCWGSRWFLSTFAVLSFASFLLSCIISYAVFKGLQHAVDGQIPFISDTGASTPESSIFGQMLNITALIVGLTSYFRTKQVESLLDHHSLPRSTVQCGCTLLSLHSCFFGVLSALGMSIVGNFQETWPTKVPHLIGAGMAFLLGMVYIWKQTVLSVRLRHYDHRKWLMFVKLAVTVAATTSLLGMLLCGFFMWFSDAEPGAMLQFRNGAAVCEWVAAVFMGLFFTTFVWDFRAHTAKSPQIVMREQGNESRLQWVDNCQLTNTGHSLPESPSTQLA